MIKAFLIGAITGGAAVWLWGDRLRDRLDDMTSDVRRRAASRLERAADTLHAAADTVQEGLGGAEPRAS